MLRIEQAARRAQQFLGEEAGSGEVPLALVETERAQVGGVFYFGCQSAAYLRSGDFRDMAIGVGYVAVDGETGKCRMLGAAESAELDLF
ncbi:YrhB domain-containing protein [Streptomyces collinus]|uniref:YrhB domain-containing protein n=1 Tax=Streptomyces collinus TaxID=42684 RepID=UPI0036946C3F